MYTLVSIQEHLKWQEILDALEIQDIYYTTQYFLSALKLDPGEAYLFYFQSEHGEVAYPFIKRLVNEEEPRCFDIATPFGYGGPVLKVLNDSSSLVEEFREQFLAFCKSSQIIAEFIRFHPSRENANFFKDHVQLLPIYESHSVDLKLWHKEPTDPVILDDIDIRKLGTVRHMFEFLVLYYSEARRREEADSYYFFTNDYFEALVSSLGPNLHLFGAYYKEKLISACYVLAMGKTIHFHLEGNLPEATAHQADRKLLTKVAEWGMDNYYEEFHLGGSLDSELGEAKQAIANKPAYTFYIGKYIHNEGLYQQFIALNDSEIVRRYRNI